MIAVRLLFTLLLMPAATWAAEGVAASDPSGGIQLTRRILAEIARTQTHQLLLATLKWTVLGALIGFACGLGLVLLLRAFRWFDSDWPHAAWVRWSFWILMVLGGITFLGVAGFWKGAVRGIEEVVVRSQFGTKVLPVVGGWAADVVAGLNTYLADTIATARSPTNLQARIASFRANEWEVNAPQFVRQLEHLKSEAVENLIPGLEREALQRFPQLNEEPARTVLRRGKDLLVASLLQSEPNTKLQDLGADRVYHVLRTQLLSEARLSGDPATIGRRELSDLLVRKGLVPAIMTPIRAIANSQRNVCFLLLAATWTFPPLLFRLTCGRVRAPTIRSHADHAN